MRAAEARLQRVDHHQQLHQVVVRRRARRLHDEHVPAAHVLLDLDLHLAVGEAADVGAAERQRSGDARCRARAPGWRCPRTSHASESTIQVRRLLSLVYGVVVGWGGRIRTSEWRDQNPLPYHLATPQLSIGDPGQQRRAIQPAHYVPAPARRQARPDSLRSVLVGQGHEHTGAGSGQSCLTKFLKPIKGFSDLRIAAAHARLAVVAPARGEKAAYCRDGGITCQFSGLKDVRRAHRGLRFDDQEIALGKVVRRRAARQRLRPMRPCRVRRTERPHRASTLCAPTRRQSNASCQI